MKARELKDILSTVGDDVEIFVWDAYNDEQSTEVYVSVLNNKIQIGTFKFGELKPCGMCGSIGGTYKDDDRGGWQACVGCGAI